MLGEKEGKEDGEEWKLVAMNPLLSRKAFLKRNF